MCISISLSLSLSISISIYIYIYIYAHVLYIYIYVYVEAVVAHICAVAPSALGLLLSNNWHNMCYKIRLTIL